MEEMLLHTDNSGAAITEIESLGGRVTLLLGDNLVVAKVPRELIARKNSFVSASAHISSTASPETLVFAQAYYKAREEMAKPKPSPQHWTDKTPPMALPQESPALIEAVDSPYRQTMTGHIAFAAVIVSGPGSLAISDSERDTIISEVTAGLQFWLDNAPDSANLRFSFYYDRIPITAADSSSCSTHSACHDRFANPALQSLNYAAGESGRDQLARRLIAHSGADGAYLGFFSKYIQMHFAYAYLGGGPLFMQYSNDGWGPSQIDRVFAHETGHVFNALDEYTNCDCYNYYGEGTCRTRNSNCVSCTARQVSCIMDGNEFELCSHTKEQLGWC